MELRPTTSASHQLNDKGIVYKCPYSENRAVYFFCDGFMLKHKAVCVEQTVPGARIVALFIFTLVRVASFFGDTGIPVCPLAIVQSGDEQRQRRIMAAKLAVRHPS